MIGSGIFNSPKDLIGVANPQSAMLSWLIGGFGALMLALVFVYLNDKRPDLRSGIFNYAREGFGDYMGFNAAWGYWSMGWLGNISYLLLFFKTLNDLLGNNALSPITAFIVASVINWIYFYVIASGVKEGAITNMIVTIAKLLPIFLVIILGFIFIKNGNFTVPDWKYQLASTGDKTTPFLQIKNAMAIILWCFVGLEASTVLAGRAKSQRAVRSATIISLLVALTIYILVSVVSMSVVPAKELYNSTTPLALVLSKTYIGQVGSFIVQIGIMVSVIGAGLSWLLLSTETMYSAARSGVMPIFVIKENRKQVPINSLLMSLVFVQFFLLALLSPAINKMYLTAITLATSLVLIPYLLSTLYAVKLSFKDLNSKNFIHFIIAILGVVYSVYVIYTVGLKYLIFTLIFYSIGSALFYKAKKERNESIKRWEVSVIFTLIISSIIIIYLLLSGKITL